ncbi:MAG: c-type cytochrome [Burkholderiales bacterium]|jgi:cytochrome c
MKLSFSLFAMFVLAMAVSPAWADRTLAQKKVCLSCHGVEKRTGFPAPSFQEVGAKYTHDPQAQERLALKVMRGGTGAWGVMTMPANPQVSEAEARQLVAWILSLK